MDPSGIFDPDLLKRFYIFSLRSCNQTLITFVVCCIERGALSSLIFFNSIRRGSMKSKVVLVLALAFVMSAYVYAQTGPAGKWTGEVQGRGGATPLTLELKVSGGTLTGTWTQGENKSDISDGKVVDANTITFKRSVAGRGGGEPIQIDR